MYYICRIGHSQEGIQADCQVSECYNCVIAFLSVILYSINTQYHVFVYTPIYTYIQLDPSQRAGSDRRVLGRGHLSGP